jgi:hypothetical protein
MKKHQNSMIILALIMIFCGFDTMTMVSSQGYFSRFSSQAYDVIGKAIAPLQAGYGFTDQQKADASATIAKLEAERKQILVALSTSAQPFTLQRRLKEINDELYQQKLITGQVWSKQRKIVLGLLASAGAVALGFGAYKYFLQQPFSVIELIKLKEAQMNEVLNNPASTDEDKEKAEREFEEALRKVPYHSPNPVPLDNVDALEKRKNEIAEQRRVAGYWNPNFNEEEYRIAEQQYKEARLLPQNILKLEKELEDAKLGYGQYSTDKKIDYSTAFKKQREYDEVVDIMRERATYSPPPPVKDPHDVNELKQRLDTIDERRKVRIGSKVYDLPHSWNWAIHARNDEKAKEDYEAALKQYAKEYVPTIPYISPDLVVDENDVNALWKRMSDIRGQQTLNVGGKYFWNPNYNEADYNAAKKQYEMAVLKEKPEGYFFSSEWQQIHRFLENNPVKRFQHAMHIGTYKDTARYGGEEVEAVEAFNKLDELTQLKLLAQAYPYVTPEPTKPYDLQAAKDRYEKIKAQQNIEYDNKTYPNLSFNQDDLIKAEQDYEKARLANLGTFGWLSEWWKGSPSAQPAETVQPMQPAVESTEQAETNPTESIEPAAKQAEFTQQ